MTTEYWGWHFSAGKEAYGRSRKLESGVTLSVRPPLYMCSHGLHASAKPLDALGYGSGPLVSRVRLFGEVLVDTDKACATRREHLVVVDASSILHEFGCWCAEEAIHYVQERWPDWQPDSRSLAVIETKRRWLKGEATDKELAAARAAAGAAADGDASAAWAAKDAAGAASAAVWAAARAAAWDAARAAKAAAREKQNAKLQEMLLAAFPELRRGPLS